MAAAEPSMSSDCRGNGLHSEILGALAALMESDRESSSRGTNDSSNGEEQQRRTEATLSLFRQLAGLLEANVEREDELKERISTLERELKTKDLLVAKLGLYIKQIAPAAQSSESLLPPPAPSPSSQAQAQAQVQREEVDALKQRLSEESQRGQQLASRCQGLESVVLQLSSENQQLKGKLTNMRRVGEQYKDRSAAECIVELVGANEALKAQLMATMTELNFLEVKRRAELYSVGNLIQELTLRVEENLEAKAVAEADAEADLEDDENEEEEEEEEEKAEAAERP